MSLIEWNIIVMMRVHLNSTTGLKFLKSTKRLGNEFEKS